MDRRLEETILAPSQFADISGGINVKKLCELFGLDQAMLSRATGASRQTISNYFDESRFIHFRDEKQRDFFTKLDNLYSMLSVLTNERRRKEEIQKWLHSPNRSLGMRRPVEVIQDGKINLLMRKIRDILESAQGA